MMSQENFNTNEYDIKKKSSLGRFLSSIRAALFPPINEVDVAISSNAGLFCWISTKCDKTSFSWGIETKSIEIEKISESTSRSRTYISGVFPSSKTLFRKVCIPITVPPKDRPLALMDILQEMVPPNISLEQSDEHMLYSIAYWYRATTDDLIVYDVYIALKEELALEQAKLTEEISCPIDSIFPKAASLQAWAKNRSPEIQNQLIVDVSMNETTVILLIDGEIVIQQCISNGLTVFEGLENNLSSDSKALSNELMIFLESIQAALYASQSKMMEKNRAQSCSVSIVGPITSSEFYTHFIKEYIQEKQGDSFYFSIKPFEETDTVAAEYGALILGKEKNIFSKPHTVPKWEISKDETILVAKRHIKTPFYTLLGASCILSCFIFLFAYQKGREIEEKNKNEWQTFRNSLTELPLFQSEINLLPSQEEPLSVFGQKNFLIDFQEEIQKNTIFQLNPEIPSLLETILKIDTIIDTIQKEALPQEIAVIELQSLKYCITKRPDSKRPQEPYQVRVDLDFTANSQATARKFYDAILQAKSFINTKNEIKWSATGGKYKTSFYLAKKPALGIAKMIMRSEHVPE